MKKRCETLNCGIIFSWVALFSQPRESVWAWVWVWVCGLKGFEIKKKELDRIERTRIGKRVSYKATLGGIAKA